MVGSTTLTKIPKLCAEDECNTHALPFLEDFVSVSGIVPPQNAILADDESHDANPRRPDLTLLY